MEVLLVRRLVSLLLSLILVMSLIAILALIRQAVVERELGRSLQVLMLVQA